MANGLIVGYYREKEGMMGKFKQAEKPRQVEFKDSAPYFSDAAGVEGFCKGYPYTFCLPVEHA